jgi:hypothetical protein
LGARSPLTGLDKTLVSTMLSVIFLLLHADLDCSVGLHAIFYYVSVVSKITIIAHDAILEDSLQDMHF